jgi:hypothetical protein
MWLRHGMWVVVAVALAVLGWRQGARRPAATDRSLDDSAPDRPASTAQLTSV